MQRFYFSLLEATEGSNTAAWTGASCTLRTPDRRFQHAANVETMDVPIKASDFLRVVERVEQKHRAQGKSAIQYPSSNAWPVCADLLTAAFPFFRVHLRSHLFLACLKVAVCLCPARSYVANSISTVAALSYLGGLRIIPYATDQWAAWVYQTRCQWPDIASAPAPSSSTAVSVDPPSAFLDCVRAQTQNWLQRESAPSTESKRRFLLPTSAWKVQSAAQAYVLNYIVRRGAPALRSAIMTHMHPAPHSVPRPITPSTPLWQPPMSVRSLGPPGVSPLHMLPEDTDQRMDDTGLRAADPYDERTRALLNPHVAILQAYRPYTSEDPECGLPSARLAGCEQITIPRATQQPTRRMSWVPLQPLPWLHTQEVPAMTFTASGTNHTIKQPLP
jgi:hypothetical protein